MHSTIRLAMFRYELVHELRYWLTRWTIYFYGAVFIGLAVLIYAGTMGFFDPIPEEETLEAWINSPSSINHIILYFHKLMLILLPTVVGASLYKDYKKQAHYIIYSFPIKKSAYLLGRLSATILLVSVVSILVISGLMAVEQLDGLNHNLMGAFRPMSYLHTFLLYVLPNWLILGLVTFAVVMRTRKIYSAYLVILFPFLIQLIAENAFAGNGFLVSLFDPFGQNVAGFYQSEWDITTRNIRQLPVDSLLILNRVIWLGLASGIFWFAYRKFEFVEHLERISKSQKEGMKVEDRPAKQVETYTLQTAYSAQWYLLVWWRTTTKSLFQISKSLAFWITSILGLLAMVFIMLKVTYLEDFVLVPATQLIIGTPAILYSMIVTLVTFVFVGSLVHRESHAEMSHLVETTPAPLSVLLLGKWTGILFMQLLMLGLFMLSGILFQLFSGYTEIDLWLYAYSLFILQFIPLITWSLVSFFIHIFIRNLYLSLFILLLGWVGVQGFPTLGISSYLLRFNEMPRLQFSPFNGFGSLISSYYFVAFYWFSLGILVFTIGTLLYRMGDSLSWKDRMKDFRSRMTWKATFLMSGAIAGMLILGVEINRGEKQQFSPNERDAKFQSFKNEFERYRQLPQPRIVSLNATIDLFPETKAFECTGFYMLVNKSNLPIDSLLISTGFDEHTTLILDVPHEVLQTNSYMKTQLIRLGSSLNVGDSLRLAFQIQSSPNTLFERNSNVLFNGTFLGQDIFPRLGFGFVEEMPLPTDSSVYLRHYQSIDSDKVLLDLTIGTSFGQLALAPGRLIEQSKREDRSYFRYQADPMKFSFGINSASYQTHTMSFGTRTIELYYLHDRMLNSMIEGVKSAIDFGENLFGTYPHEVLRIIEFPLSEGTYATAYGNNLVLSEARFLTNEGAMEGHKVNIAFYVSAHETMHHWWGNEVIPAYAKGATMLTESITEYLMLRLLEEHKGKEAMIQFYDLQAKRYESGRREFKKVEPPLMFVEPDQQFISYGKGAIALFDLSEAIGKKRFHELLADFMRINKEEMMYPTSLDFVNFLKNQLDESGDKLVEEALERVAD